MELKDMLKTLIELSKKTKHSTDTETYVYPIKNNIPRIFFKELGIELINENDYLKVFEIQFDTLLIVFQCYNGEGENYGGEIDKKLDELSESLIKWCINNITIKRYSCVEIEAEEGEEFQDYVYEETNMSVPYGTTVGVEITKDDTTSFYLIDGIILGNVIESWDQKIERFVEEGIDEIFSEAHQMANTKTGDITPSQMGALNKIKGDLENLIKEQVKQNL